MNHVHRIMGPIVLRMGWTSLGVSVEYSAKRISIQSYVQSVDRLPGVMSLSSNSVLLPVQ